MINRRRAYIILALLLTLTLTDVSAQQQQQQPPSRGRSVRGHARYSSGGNVAWIIVRLLSAKNQAITVTVTNYEGEFQFGDLAETSYTIVLTAPDHQIVTERVDFNGRGAVAPKVELTLLPDTAPQRSPSRLAFTQNVPKSARDTFERAIKLGKAGRKQVANTMLQEAIRIFPDYFDAHFALGSELMKAGRMAEAIAELEQASRINPRDDRVYQTFGVILMRQAKYDVASALFAEAARLDPTEPLHPLMRATALMDYASAINPTQAETTAALAAERDMALAEAERNLITANEKSNKQLAVVHMQMARLYQRRGERGRAADELDQYLLTNPTAKDADEIRDIIKKLRLPAEGIAPASQPR
ncbi:MAG TPA: tetratricopeptide repeat protein [Pyrinomonadaceae bacterium]|jgi:tetratricopeptide (TPR) repeat protein